MTEFIRDKAASTEVQQKKALAFLFAQDSVGLATDGVLTGLVVTQTGTASANVLISAGAGVSQDTVGNGASELVNDTQKTLDILTANPMGATPRNDIVVFDSATTSIRVIVGTPNAVPTDPTVPATAIALARLRHAASATTVPTAKIDDIRSFTSLFGGNPQGKRVVRGQATANAATDVNGYTTVNHGAPFTPTWVHAADSLGRQSSTGDTLGPTTFRIRILQADGSVFAGVTPVVTFTVAE